MNKGGPAMRRETIGFIGLGNIGKPMADNIARAGFDMAVHDVAGASERAPEGAAVCGSAADVAGRSTAIFLSLPTIEAVEAVVGEIAESGAGDDAVVVNTSTVSPETSVAAHGRLSAQGVGYVDAPISGGVLRARDRTLTVIYSGDEAAFARLEPVFRAISEHVFRVGDGAGQAQRMKLLNNYLAISAMVANSEALAYGAAGGLDMKTMLDVINVSSGQNFMSSTWFPRCLLSGVYQCWSTAGIIHKDLSLFVKSAAAERSSHRAARATLDVFEAFAAEDPEVDQMHIYDFVRDGKG